MRVLTGVPDTVVAAVVSHYDHSQPVLTQQPTHHYSECVVPLYSLTYPRAALERSKVIEFELNRCGYTAAQLLMNRNNEERTGR